MSGGQFLVRMRNILSKKKKKKPKTCLGFLKTPPLLSSDRQFITLAAFRKRTSSIFGQPFCLYKLRVSVCVRQVNALRINPE